MKKLLPIAAVLLLTGCGATIQSAAQARDECHALGGTYTQWRDDFGSYHWNCDLSDGADQKGTEQ